MARTTLNNYLLPCQSNSIAAKAHHHPAWVAVARVSRTKAQNHSDVTANIFTQYVKELTNPFENIEFEDTDKEKAEEQKQQKKK
ncbi:hypothetical protein RhiirA4_485104 [Rhizophagus irregularis]|uniref:Uncharacterized protein n=1 Tax=Rhizophagus irregularis TaxID=588596 RepID=A0A2I1HPQ2_9GLOM|nr:hypothetical protein RhiirA4_485104 [Rhizophagus irregularis]